jgi:hypothetical protein
MDRLGLDDGVRLQRSRLPVRLRPRASGRKQQGTEKRFEPDSDGLVIHHASVLIRNWIPFSICPCFCESRKQWQMTNLKMENGK